MMSRISYRMIAWLLVFFLSLSSVACSSFIFEGDVPVTMSDGVVLPVNIARPADDGKYPVILLRTPYGKPGEDNGDMKSYAQAGYVMVVQDCRGTGKAGGEWEPFLHDPQDGLETQAWIAEQPWCDGRIGLSGGSYVGWTQWASLPGARPEVRCAVPVVPFAECYPDLAYQGGAFQLVLLMGWGAMMGGAGLTEESAQEAFRYLPLNTFGNQFKKPVPYLNAWVEHADPSGDYWRLRGINGRYSEIEAAVLNIGGWYDIFSKPVLDLCTRVRQESTSEFARKNQHVVVGPWAHGVGARKVGALDFGADAETKIHKLQFDWFEHWLKDKDTGVEAWPPCRIFVMGENRWRNENEWPLARTVYTPFYLHSSGSANTRSGDGTLSKELPSEEAADRFVYDPENPVPTAGGNNLFGAPAGPFDQSALEERADVLVYTSEVLEEALEVTGPVHMILHAASSAPDTDFTAKLLDVHPDGKAYNLCDGIVRARFRRGMDQELFLTPGEAVEMDIDLWVTSNLFLPGHRIRVEISSSNFPRFDRNPNSGLPFGTDTVLHPAEQTVFHDSLRPSHILLPVIPR